MQLEDFFALLSYDLRVFNNYPEKIVEDLKNGIPKVTNLIHDTHIQTGCSLKIKNELGELILVKWMPHQKLILQNTILSNSWMAVLSGKVKEILYCVPDELFESYTGELCPCSLKEHESGSVTYLPQKLGIQEIMSEDVSVTLHLFAYT